jgi:hypothetical protein
MNGSPMPTAREIIRFTEEVLRRPEFHHVAKPTRQRLNFLERLLTWLASRGPVRIGPAGVIVLKTLFIVALVILVAYLVRLLLSGSMRWAPPAGRLRSSRDDSPEGAAVGGGLSGSLEDAELALKQGDLRTSVRILYQNLIERLTRGGFLKAALWKTSLTYLRECPPSAEHFPMLEETVQAYNAIVYGHLSYDNRVIERLLSGLRDRDGPR